MLASRLPVLNLNNWSLYFGGPDNLSHQDHHVVVRWIIICSCLSAVFQLSLLVLKTIKSQRLTTQQALMYVLSGNFLNVTGLVTSVAGASSFIFIYVLINHDYYKIEYEENMLPPPIVVITTVIILFYQWRPFITNHALRY